MPGAEVPQLLEAVKDKQEEFIRSHMIRGLIHRGGEKLARFLSWYSIFRRPVFIEGVQKIGEKAAVKGWKELLYRGVELSLVEHNQTRNSYRVTPLLREELLTGLDDEDIQLCHQVAFEYYKKVCEAQESFDPVLEEEWIFHALGCGEEKTAAEQGGRLVKHLQECLAFRESRRVGEWILAEKKQELANEYDAFLLNETAFTLKKLGEYNKALEYYEQAHIIDRSLFGESHYTTARDLNNLGSALRDLGEPGKAIEYYEQALRIVRASEFERKYPNFIGALLDNLGSAWSCKGEYEKAIEYYKQALATLKKKLGENNPRVAITLNNLGSAWNNLGNHDQAADYFKQALSIDLSVYGKVHPDVATDLNNLGAVCYDQDDYPKAIEYYEEALTIWRKIYQEKHQNIIVTLYNVGKAYFALDQKEKAKKCFEEAYPIFKELFGVEHPSTKTMAQQLEAVRKTEG